VAPQAVPITLTLPGELATTAVATVQDRNVAARCARAGGALLAAWSIAGLCVFLPLAHFVLVPGFGVAGLFLAVARLREGRSLLRVDGVCPRCKVRRALPGAGRFRDGGSVHCEGCGSQLEVHVGVASQAVVEAAPARGPVFSHRPGPG
jgi:hypothetical protein